MLRFCLNKKSPMTYVLRQAIFAESNLESSNSRAACDNVYQTLQSNQTQRLDEEPVFGPPQLNFCQGILQ